MLALTEGYRDVPPSHRYEDAREAEDLQAVWKTGCGRGRSSRGALTPGVNNHPTDPHPWLSLAVIAQRGGRRRTKANLNGRLRTTTNGFEDRVSKDRGCPPTSTQDRTQQFSVHRRLRLCTGVCEVGCHLGCHQKVRNLGTRNPMVRFPARARVRERGKHRQPKS